MSGGFVSVIAVLAMLATTIPAQAHPTMEREFDRDEWSDGLVDVRSSDRRNTRRVSTDLASTGLEVNIPSGSLRGLGPFDRLPRGTDEAWYRYHVKLVDFKPKSSGKLPGFSGLYSRTARGCLPSRSGSPGWSARGLFGAAGSRGAPPGHVPIGIYLYHLDQPKACGEAVYWEDSYLEPERWHCIEGYVKLNTPGKRDGIVKGWLDGTERFSRSDMRFRRSSEAGVGIREMWLNVYFGGKRPTPNHLTLVIAELAVSAERRMECLDSVTDLVGSFGVMGTDGIARYDPDTGTWTVTRSRGTSFVDSPWTRYSANMGWATHLVGDFTGDGRDEIASYRPATGNWTVSRSTGDSFVPSTWARFSANNGWTTHLVGDFTGDGRDDIASYRPATGNWTVARSTGNGFVTSTWARWSANTGWETHLVGDFTGDGRDDIASYRPDTGNWTVARSTGKSFVSSTWARFGTDTAWTVHVVGDFTGDGRDEIAHYEEATGTWAVSRSTGESLLRSRWVIDRTRGASSSASQGHQDQSLPWAH